MDFDYGVKKQKKAKRNHKCQDLARELKMSMEHEAGDDTIFGWCNWNNPKRIGKMFGNKRTRRDHPDYSINKNIQNTEKSPGDLRRLTTTQTPVKNHLLGLKNFQRRKQKEIIIIVLRLRKHF